MSHSRHLGPRTVVAWRGWLCTACCLWGGAVLAVASEPLVPGTGVPVTKASDDFEDEAWEYVFNNPKSSGEQDGRRRAPFGFSKNGAWSEGIGRGHPDLIKRIETPEGGLPGSRGALQIATLNAGIPGTLSNSEVQDDLFLNVSHRAGGAISVQRQPSIVVRVYVPPVETWENRTGSHFAFRASVTGQRPYENWSESYWPGLFFQLYDGASRKDGKDHPFLLVRAAERGQDYYKRALDSVGWWTLGMSFTSDGRVHYYAKPGIENLTSSDYLASHFAYSFRCQRLTEVFFDIWSRCDGEHWSSQWIIDDPTVYVVGNTAVAHQPGAPRQR